MTRARIVSAATVALAFAWPLTASAQQPGDDSARAEASFQEAMRLRAAGQDAQACANFAESQRLAPGIGVTLYLADCYQRVGRSASAWREFRRGEKLARDRNDKRADVAGQRAAALEPQLFRLTVAPGPATAAEVGAEVQVDGAVLPPGAWNVALAIDPGDHVVTFAAIGQPSRKFDVHVDASNPNATVRIDDSAPAAAAEVPAPAAVPSSAPPSPAEMTTSTDGDLAWRVAGVGLMLAGAAGVGVGTWFVTDKTPLVMANGQVCDPHLRRGAIPDAAVAFSLGGVGILSGITLYYTHRPGRMEVSIAPAVVPGGAGAQVRATF